VTIHVNVTDYSVEAISKQVGHSGSLKCAAGSI
jgi:hypothetical protein